MSTTHRTAAITGAGSGLGRELAEQLTQRGYLVFGTVLSPEEGDGFSQPERISTSAVDVTDETAVRRWAGEVTDVVGDHGLDLLISNAGILTPGPMEVLPLDAVRHEFEVNVFGSLAVINAFLPALRTARGRIVQIGAMTGWFPLPFNGPSSASKATLEAFADVYRNELRPFGVDFVIAQAGNMLTGGPAKTAAVLERTAASFTDTQQALYGEAFNAFTTALNAMQGNGLSAHDSASRVIELAEQEPAPSRAPVGADAADILRQVHERSDSELDDLRLALLGLPSR